MEKRTKTGHPVSYRKITGAQPVGSGILVEILHADEMIGTKLMLTEKANVGAPQGRILAIGTGLNEGHGLKPGMRVLLQGKYVPVPKYDNNTHEVGVVQYQEIKAILLEEEETA